MLIYKCYNISLLLNIKTTVTYSTDKDIFNIIKKQAPGLNDKFIPTQADNLISRYISAKKLIDPSSELSFDEAQNELKDIFLDADRKLENKAQLFDLIMYYNLGAGKDKFYLLILERLIEIRTLDSASDLEVVYSYEWGKKQRADQFIEKRFLNYIYNEEGAIKTNKLGSSLCLVVNSYHEIGVFLNFFSEKL